MTTHYQVLGPTTSVEYAEILYLTLTDQVLRFSPQWPVSYPQQTYEVLLPGQDTNWNGAVLVDGPDRSSYQMTANYLTNITDGARTAAGYQLQLVIGLDLAAMSLVIRPDLQRSNQTQPFVLLDPSGGRTAGVETVRNRPTPAPGPTPAPTPTSATGDFAVTTISLAPGRPDVGSPGYRQAYNLTGASRSVGVTFQ